MEGGFLGAGISGGGGGRREKIRAPTGPENYLESVEEGEGGFLSSEVIKQCKFSLHLSRTGRLSLLSSYLNF